MKKIFIFLISLCSISLFSNNVYALYGNMISTNERTENNKYLVNKKWDVTESNLDNVLNTPAVDLNSKIYDYSNVLSESEKNKLKEEIDTFISKHNMDMVILTADVSYSYDKYNDTVASDFYDYNDFGIDFSHYSGILLFRNTYSLDPYYDMYTFGDAQLYFNSERYNDILDSIYDDLHSGYYLDGFTNFISMCDNYIIEGIPDVLSDSYIDDENNAIVYGDKYLNSPEYTGKEKIGNGTIVFLGIIFSSIITAIFLGINIHKNKMIIKAKNANDYMLKDSLVYTVKEDRFITSHTSSVRISSNSGSSSGGGHSSFGSSGGGFSSGGGRHG